MSVTITIPDSVMASADMSESELKQEIALVFYRQSKLTLSQARQFADMSRPDFKRLLVRREMAIYDVAEFEKDLETLKAMGQL